MGVRLTTVAVYDTAAGAHIAKNLLAAAGIDAVVSDEQVVAMDFLLANAVGGIKVQVRAGDAGRATEVLGKRLGDTAGVVTTSVDEDELTRQALAAVPEGEEPFDAGPGESREPEAEPDGGGPSGRDADALRFLRAAVFSLVLCPLAFYAFHLFLNAAFGPGPLSHAGRRRLLVGGAILFGVWGWWFVLLVALKALQ